MLLNVTLCICIDSDTRISAVPVLRSKYAHIAKRSGSADGKSCCHDAFRKSGHFPGVFSVILIVFFTTSHAMPPIVQSPKPMDTQPVIPKHIHAICTYGKPRLILELFIYYSYHYKNQQS